MIGKNDQNNYFREKRSSSDEKNENKHVQDTTTRQEGLHFLKKRLYPKCGGEMISMDNNFIYVGQVSGFRNHRRRSRYLLGVIES